MSETTITDLESIRESITQDIIAAATEKIASGFHDLRTQLQNALRDFATQADLEQIVEKAVSTAAGVAAGVASDSVRVLRESQEAHQEEQRQKVQAFIDEMRGRMDTFATIADVSSLRTTMEDTHRHFESITGAHREALDTLKIRVDKLETSTEKNVTAIRADTKTIKDNAQKTSQAVINLIKENEKRNREIDRELSTMKDAQDDDVKNLRRVDSQTRSLDMIIRDVDERVRTTQTRIEAALFGDEKEKTPGLVAKVDRLNTVSFLSGTKFGRGIVLLAYMLLPVITALLMGRPDIARQFIPGS